jgi:DNA-binding GntR family transcriptional regulator
MVIKRFASQAARTYEKLRQMILTGQLAPGEKIGVREMAAKLGVSNGPIRDALLQLSNEKLVERGYGVEWSIVRPTREMIDGILTVREALEVQSARCCAENAHTEDVDRLMKLAQQLDSSVQQELYDDLLTSELDARLHLEMAEVSGSSQLCEEVERWKVVMEWAHIYVRMRGGAKNRHGESHVELIKAIGTGDPDVAERQMRRHVRHPWDEVKWEEEMPSEAGMELPSPTRLPIREISISKPRVAANQQSRTGQ